VVTVLCMCVTSDCKICNPGIWDKEFCNSEILFSRLGSQIGHFLVSSIRDRVGPYERYIRTIGSNFDCHKATNSAQQEVGL